MCMGELLGRALFVVGGRRRRGRHWRAEWRALLYLWSLSAIILFFVFFFSSRRRHTRCSRDWSSDVCSSDLILAHCPRLDGSVLHGWQCRSRGARRGRGVAHSEYRYRGGAGSAPERPRSVRLLRALAFLVPDVLRSLRRTWHTTAAAMRGAALFVRGARPVAAIRERVPRILPAAGAAARPQYHLLDAGSDAGATPDLQRMGSARHLLGPFGECLF